MKKAVKKKQLIEFDGRLSKEAEDLNRYLCQYGECMMKKKTLERRRETIQVEFSPIKSPQLTGMPHSGSYMDTPVAALMYRLDEIDEKINDQIAKSTKLLADIMNIIDLLPETSRDEIITKAIIENRYIDRMGWDKIERENHCSRSMVFRYWKRGLYNLLEFKKVGKILKEYYKSA